MECTHAKTLIPLYVSNDLTVAETIATRQHLADCGCLLQGRIRGLKLFYRVAPLLQELSFEVHYGLFSAPAGCVAIVHLQDAKITIQGKHVGLRQTQPSIALATRK